MAESLGEFYNTAYLTGKNTVGERIRAYNDLQNDSTDLEVLCSVDILNEGVDIPGVNMVCFLRPTESSTVFIQQLGRGLRKCPNKDYVTVLDFIGNSYKRSVQIAFALGSLAQNLVLEKRLMMEMVKDNFCALGLEEYGVKIQIDDLSKEEIITFLENENFNSLSYLTQDYFNFKKYTCSEFYPRHMDYLNNDCAPDLQRFMNIKIAGKKTGCYYGFLKGIEEEDIPDFSEKQIDFLKYTSSLLPLVRPYEYVAIRLLLNKPYNTTSLKNAMREEISGFDTDCFDHMLKYMLKKNAVLSIQGILKLNTTIDDQFKEHLEDLLEYGLVKYNADYSGEAGFLLWHGYSMNQVQLKLLKDPDYNQKGTYTYGKTVVIFASIKKDASVEEKLNYKDKFIDEALFQWESVNNISDNELYGLKNSEEVLLFIRKVASENGITMPFTYVGKGKLTNPRIQNKIDIESGKSGRTCLFDIVMENSLPDYLQFDFGLN